MDQQPTVYGSYIVTGHRFTYVPVKPDDDERSAIVLLHQSPHQVNEPAPHSVIVRESDLLLPAYRLGAIWRLVFSGENAHDDAESA